MATLLETPPARVHHLAKVNNQYGSGGTNLAQNVDSGSSRL
jgi:hypothetical protein